MSTNSLLPIVTFIVAVSHGLLSASGADCFLPPITLTASTGTPIEVCIGHGRLITVEVPTFLVGDVDIADEHLCRRVIRRAHSGTFELVGLVEGETTVTVWPEDSVSAGALPPPLQVKVVIREFSDRYGPLTAFINDRLNAGLPAPEVDIAIIEVPLSGKVLVSGKVKTCAQLSHVHSYIEGAIIPSSRLLYEVNVSSGCHVNCCCYRCRIRSRR